MRDRLIVLAAALMMAGCRPETQRTDSVDPNAGVEDRASWDARMVEHLDAGNAAIRADSFAVAHYPHRSSAYHADAWIARGAGGNSAHLREPAARNRYPRSLTAGWCPAPMAAA